MHRLTTVVTLTLAVLASLLLAALVADGREPAPRTAGLVKSLSDYQAACTDARNEFLKKLRDAERKAKAEKNSDEATRLNGWIKRAELAEPFPEFDPLADARKKIADSTWSFDRPAQSQKGRMTFHKDGVWETTIPQKGHWIMATEQMVICSFRGKTGDEVFVFNFDAEYRKYEVRAFTDTPTNFVGGQRQR